MRMEPTESTNLDIYGGAELPWSRAEEALSVGAHGVATPFFLGTVRPDGRPHSAALGVAWHDGGLYFTSGPGTRKSRNLSANPACTLSTRLPGIDVVFEGEAARVTDAPTLEALAALYRGSGWPVEVDGDAFTAPFSAPSAGPPPWHLYRLAPHTAFGVATAEPFGATRWRF
jgi:Pyridoxamine 5'-phosphate oxidase